MEQRGNNGILPQNKTFLESCSWMRLQGLCWDRSLTDGFCCLESQLQSSSGCAQVLFTLLQRPFKNRSSSRLSTYRHIPLVFAFNILICEAIDHFHGLLTGSRQNVVLRVRTTLFRHLSHELDDPGTRHSSPIRRFRAEYPSDPDPRGLRTAVWPPGAASRTPHRPQISRACARCARRRGRSRRCWTMAVWCAGDIRVLGAIAVRCRSEWGGDAWAGLKVWFLGWLLCEESPYRAPSTCPRRYLDPPSPP